MSGAEEWRTSPRPVADGLESLARRLGAPTASSLGSVFSRWEEVVGTAVAAHARPLGLTDGILLVVVDQPGWATQLRYLSSALIVRLAEVAGTGVVGRIDIRVEGQSWREPGPDVKAAGEADFRPRRRR